MESFAPIWVFHPITGKEVNVAPLLYWLDQFDAKPNAEPGEGALLAVGRIGRAMNLAVHNPDNTSTEKLVDLYIDIHRLEDMFKEIPTRITLSATSVVETGGSKPE